MRKQYIYLAGIALTAFLLGGLTQPASAQQVGFYANPSQYTPLGAGEEDVVLGGADATLLRNMSSSWWKSIRRENVAALASPATPVRAQSLQNIIFLATQYPKQSRFHRSVSDIYHVYRFDDDDQLRIMALQALCAVGHDDTMRQLVQDVQHERSPVVRRMTLSALGQYFHVREK